MTQGAYYLSSWVGRGTCSDPFRPRGSEQPGWSGIDLRPDGGATREGGGLNACLLYLPEHDPALIKVAEAKDEALTPGGLRRFCSRFHLDTPFTRFHELVADLLMCPPSGGWQALKDTRIYLGGLLWSMPRLAGMTTLTESWTHADTLNSSSTSLTADLTWTKQNPTGAWNILTNQARCVGSDVQLARCESPLSTNDLRAVCTVVDLVTNDAGGSTYSGGGPAGRLSGADFASAYAALAYRNGNNTDNSFYLEKRVGSSQSVIAGPNTTDPVNGDTVGLVCSGSSISLERNGSTLISPVTDSAVDGTTVGGKYPGIIGFVNGTFVSGNPVLLDVWSAADLGAPPVVPFVTMQIRKAP